MQASALYTTDLLQLLCLTVAVTAAFIAGAAYWRRHHQPATPASPPARPNTPPAAIAYRDAPTIQAIGSQRVDRIRKVVQLRTGESTDILDTPRGLPPRFRITLRSIVTGSDLDAVQIAVELGGTQVSCGPLVHEMAFNEFVIPRATRDEHRRSVFHYHEHGDSLEFMRIKLRFVDAAAGYAELDVMQLHGHWPGCTRRRSNPSMLCAERGFL
jgi:hypothetical protein